MVADIGGKSKCGERAHFGTIDGHKKRTFAKAKFCSAQLCTKCFCPPRGWLSACKGVFFTCQSLQCEQHYNEGRSRVGCLILSLSLSLSLSLMVRFCFWPAGNTSCLSSPMWRDRRLASGVLRQLYTQQEKNMTLPYNQMWAGVGRVAPQPPPSPLL